MNDPPVDVNILDNHCQTPIAYAIMYGNASSVWSLSNRGAVVYHLCDVLKDEGLMLYKEHEDVIKKGLWGGLSSWYNGPIPNTFMTGPDSVHLSGG